MDYQPKILPTSPTTNLYLIPQPRRAWLAILGLIFFTTICLLIGISSILQFLFPLGVFIVGAFLYKQYPVVYIGFTWWIWFLAPLVARIVEYQNGWANPGLRLIIVSPYLVTIIAGITFVRYIPKTYNKEGLPFFLAFAAVCYALFTGLVIENSAIVVIEGFLSWIPGILFGFHLFINWRSYPQYRTVIQQTFCWGILFMGIYGLIQNQSLPAWDRFWLDNAEELISAIGSENTRIWATLNSPFVFANMAMVALLLLFSSSEKLRIPATIVGFLCILLTRVRTAWLGFVISFIVFGSSIKPKIQIRLISTIFVILLCLLPLITIDEIYEKVVPRIQTFSALQEDHSLNERFNIYQESEENVLYNIVGSGLGTKIVDAGFYAILGTLGWIGIIPYLGSILLILFKIYNIKQANSDAFVNVSRAICLSLLLMNFSNNMMTRINGAMFWGFLSICLAAKKYYLNNSREITEKT